MLLLRVKAHTKNISDSAKHANQKDRLIFISATQAFWREDVSLKDWNTVWIETTLFLRQVQLSYALSLHLVNEEAWKRQAGGGETAWVSSAGRKAMKNRILPLPINLSLSTKKKRMHLPLWGAVTKTKRSWKHFVDFQTKGRINSNSDLFVE